MQPPAVTIIYKADGTAVQTAGLEKLLADQVEALASAGRINRSGIPGAVRGEVWTSGRVVASAFFDPGAAAQEGAEEKARAEAAAKAKEETEAAEAAAKAKAEAEAAEAAAKAKAEADKTSPPTAPPAASGAGKKS